MTYDETIEDLYEAQRHADLELAAIQVEDAIDAEDQYRQQEQHFLARSTVCAHCGGRFERMADALTLDNQQLVHRPGKCQVDASNLLSLSSSSLLSA